MRRFVILGHKAPLDADFSLDDLPGAAGRLDVLCRALGASLFVSHGIRKDVEAVLVLRNEIQIRVVGATVKRLNPDERSTAALIRRAIGSLSDAEAESTPGIFVSRRTLPEVLDRLFQLEANLVVLCEQGTPSDTFPFPRNPAFILSDHVDFTDEEESLLSDLPRVSLGDKPLHTSHCITIVHHLLDRREEATNQDLVLCHIVTGEPKARLISSLLEDFDIPVNLVSHVPPGILPVTFDGLADVRIRVRPQDLEKARQIIRDYFEEPIDD
jgi:tRNA (pseudouridine54-N1)-methyltransferase